MPNANFPVTLTIDAAALAALAPGGPPNAQIESLLKDVRTLLADVKQAIDSGNKMLVDADEAASRLDISRRKLTDLTEIPHLKIGSCRKYAVSDLEAFIAKQKGVKS